MIIPNSRVPSSSGSGPLPLRPILVLDHDRDIFGVPVGVPVGVVPGVLNPFIPSRILSEGSGLNCSRLRDSGPGLVGNTYYARIETASWSIKAKDWIVLPEPYFSEEDPC